MTDEMYFFCTESNPSLPMVHPGKNDLEPQHELDKQKIWTHVHEDIIPLVLSNVALVYFKRILGR